MIVFDEALPPGYGRTMAHCRLRRLLLSVSSYRLIGWLWCVKWRENDKISRHDGSMYVPGATSHGINSTDYSAISTGSIIDLLVIMVSLQQQRCKFDSC